MENNAASVNFQKLVSEFQQEVKISSSERDLKAEFPNHFKQRISSEAKFDESCTTLVLNCLQPSDRPLVVRQTEWPALMFRETEPQEIEDAQKPSAKEPVKREPVKQLSVTKGPFIQEKLLFLNKDL